MGLELFNGRLEIFIGAMAESGVDTSSITISSDAINLTTSIGAPNAWRTILTLTNQTNPDALDTITADASWIGREIHIISAGTGDLTVTDGTSLKMSGNFIMDGADDRIAFICTAVDTWNELWRSSPS